MHHTTCAAAEKKHFGRFLDASLYRNTFIPIRLLVKIPQIKQSWTKNNQTKNIFRDREQKQKLFIISINHGISLRSGKANTFPLTRGRVVKKEFKLGQ